MALAYRTVRTRGSRQIPSHVDPLMISTQTSSLRSSLIGIRFVAGLFLPTVVLALPAGPARSETCIITGYEAVSFATTVGWTVATERIGGQGSCTVSLPAVLLAAAQDGGNPAGETTTKGPEVLAILGEVARLFEQKMKK